MSIRLSSPTHWSTGDPGQAMFSREKNTFVLGLLAGPKSLDAEGTARKAERQGYLVLSFVVRRQHEEMHYYKYSESYY